MLIPNFGLQITAKQIHLSKSKSNHEEIFKDSVKKRHEEIFITYTD